MEVEEMASTKAVSPGVRLSNERKKQGFTESEMSVQLKITLSKLKSLEKDEFDAFPAQIYLKGYLKNYARLLGIAEQEIIDSYQACAGLHRVEEYDVPPASNGGVSNTVKWVFVLLAAIVVLAVVLYSQIIVPKESVNTDSPALFEPAAVESVSELPVDEPQIPSGVLPAIAGELEQDAESLIDSHLNTAIENVESVPLVDEPVEILASKLTAIELINLSAPEADAEEVTPVLALANLNDVLTFRFTGQCWISVRDSTGSLLYSGLENAGSERQIEGEAPFQVVIGNVQNAVLALNDQSVTLQAPSDGRALRLQVGQ